MSNFTEGIHISTASPISASDLGKFYWRHSILCLEIAKGIQLSTPTWRSTQFILDHIFEMWQPKVFANATDASQIRRVVLGDDHRGGVVLVYASPRVFQISALFRESPRFRALRRHLAIWKVLYELGKPKDQSNAKGKVIMRVVRPYPNSPPITPRSWYSIWEEEESSFITGLRWHLQRDLEEMRE